VAAALEAVAAAGPASWSLDLMSGLPGLGRAAWARTLAAALAAGPDHISVYDLQVEAGTPFARLYTPGVAPLPSEAEAADQFEAAGAVLGAGGFQRYEVSNFAVSPAHRSAHNALYWRGDADWLAFGVGATSRLGGVRVARPRGVRAWVAWVERLGGEAAAGVPATDFDAPHPDPPPTRADLLTDIVMLRLRTADGLDVAEVGRAFGAGAAAAIERALTPHAAEGRAARVEGTPATWRLTDPAGFVVSNTVIADVFAALDGGVVE
jgi:oxygen-independent coproporphyrinogen-3 oxidase